MVQPMYKMRLTFASNKLDELDFMMPIRSIDKIFYECVGDYWSGAILVPKGVQMSPDMGKIVYVDFNPSIEAAAQAVYEYLAPVYKARLGITLESVETFIQMGSASYSIDQYNKSPYRYCNY